MNSHTRCLGGPRAKGGDSTGSAIRRYLVAHGYLSTEGREVAMYVLHFVVLFLRSFLRTINTMLDVSEARPRR